MDIDKLFKRPALPASALKTKHGKLAPVPPPSLGPSSLEETNGAGTSSGSAASHAHSASSVRDIPLGPESDPESPPPPTTEEGEYINPEEEEEDARFFGGGLSGQQEQIVQILDRDESSSAAAPMSQVQSVRKQLAKLERTISTNQQLRIKYADDPHKFIDSEANLDSEISSLVVLTAAPETLYREALKYQLPTTLCGLLSHENEDIVTSVVKVIEELTDEDVLDGLEEEEDTEDKGNEGVAEQDRSLSPRRAAERDMVELVRQLRANQLIELLVSNLDQFRNNVEKHSEGNGKDEETPQRAAAREADEEGIYHIFALFENLVGLDPTGVSTVLVRNATLWTNISALLRQGSEHYLAKSKGKTRRTEAFSQNEAYAAELLAVVVQAATSPSSLQEQREANEEEPSALAVAGTQRGGTNSLLESLSAFLRSPPQTDDETEVMQNLFDALCALLSEDLNRDEFVRLEGPELVVLLLSYAAGKHDTHKGPKHVSKRGVLLVKKSALRLLAYALGGQGAGTQRTAQAFVSAGGLKPLLALLGTVGKSQKGSSIILNAADEEHLLSIMVALLNLLPQESVARIRLLAKFTEHEYVNIERLVQVRSHAVARLAQADEEFHRPPLGEESSAARRGSQPGDAQGSGEAGARTEEEEMDHLLRLEQGLFARQLADYVIAWLCVEDDAMRVKVGERLRQDGVTTLHKDVVISLQTYYYDLGDDPVVVPGAVPADEGHQAPNQKEVVVDLVNSLLE